MDLVLFIEFPNGILEFRTLCYAGGHIHVFPQKSALYVSSPSVPS